MHSSSINDSKTSSIMWKPKSDMKVRTKEFWNFINQKYNVKMENYWDLHRWSLENISDFWKEIWDYMEIICSRSYDKVLDENADMSESPKWFIGAKLNYAENILRYRDDHVAMIMDGEDRESKKVTYSELYLEVCRYGAALRKLGLKKNDNVACFMSNREEAIFAMLGATAAGAIWSGALPVYGAEAVIKRFFQVKPKFLFTVDRFVYDKEEKDMLEKLKEISNAITSIEKVIIVPSRPSSRNRDISGIRNGCFMDEFLSYGNNADGSVPDLKFEQLPFDHPIFISYTSGTSGNPKALVHGFGGTLGISRDFWLQSNCTRNSTWLSVSPVGWATWTMFSSMLLHGMTLVLYEGFPFFLSPTYLWDMTDKYGITNLLIVGGCLDEMEKRNCIPNEHHHLSSLEGIISGGCVIKPTNYEFVYNKIKSDVAFSAVYGLTELLGSCFVMERSLPVHKGEVQAPSLGIDIRCFNNEGKHVLDERGELVIVKPTPSLPLFMWNDKDRTILKTLYFSKFSDNAFTTNDVGMINSETGGIILFGRSDDILKQRGCRFGSAEIYNVVNPFPEIRDSLCVSQYNNKGDERAVLFLKMEDGEQFTDDLASEIRNAIAKELSKRHIPDIILEIKEIPVNMNGKKLEIIVKKIINNMPHDSDSVANKESLSLYYNIPALKGSW